MSDEKTTVEQTEKRPLEDTELTGVVGGVGQDPPSSDPKTDTGWTPDGGDNLVGGGGGD